MVFTTLTYLQGLLGLRVKDGSAALVELNCETDFVARNQKFLALLEEVGLPRFGMRLRVSSKVCAACLKADGDGSSTISGEQVGSLVDGEGRLVFLGFKGEVVSTWNELCRVPFPCLTFS